MYTYKMQLVSFNEFFRKKSYSDDHQGKTKPGAMKWASILVPEHVLSGLKNFILYIYTYTWAQQVAVFDRFSSNLLLTFLSATVWTSYLAERIQ